jgi:hypothetical protein
MTVLGILGERRAVMGCVGHKWGTSALECTDVHNIKATSRSSNQSILLHSLNQREICSSLHRLHIAHVYCDS